MHVLSHLADNTVIVAVKAAFHVVVSCCVCEYNDIHIKLAVYKKALTAVTAMPEAACRKKLSGLLVSFVNVQIAQTARLRKLRRVVMLGKIEILP